MPKVSIITINYNDANGLEKTIQSVVSQIVKDYEFIVIDGGSTDKSTDVIKKYADKISYWVSEKDNGIYDAQNKGILKATGDYLVFLNSGDRFFNQNALAEFCDFEKSNKKKVVYGKSNVIDVDGTSRIMSPPEKLDLNFWYSNTLNHQAVFMHASMFAKYGSFSTHYKYASDFEHLFKVFLKEPLEFAYLNSIVCNYDNTGLTSKDEFHRLIIQERIQIMKLYVSNSVYSEMRSVYMNTLTFKRKCIVIITENKFLKMILKPIYKLYKKITE